MTQMLSDPRSIIDSCLQQQFVAISGNYVRNLIIQQTRAQNYVFAFVLRKMSVNSVTIFHLICECVSHPLNRNHKLNCFDVFHPATRVNQKFNIKATRKRIVKDDKFE